MTPLQAFILGIIQGLTEFLPISSSGHLVLFQKMFGLSAGVLTFDIVVHVATLIAVLAVLHKDVLDILKKPFCRLSLLIIAGTIPTVIIGFALKDFFESLFASGKTLGMEFIFTGIVLWLAEKIPGKGKTAGTTTFWDAAFVGVAQGVAILPAVSRSGLTLAGSLLRGLDREFALKFSFLMSIPAILGPALLDALDLAKGEAVAPGIPFLPMAIGFIAAAVTGYLAIRWMLRIFTHRSLKPFAYYVIVLGALIVLDQLFFHVIFI